MAAFKGHWTTVSAKVLGNSTQSYSASGWDDFSEGGLDGEGGGGLGGGGRGGGVAKALAYS